MTNETILLLEKESALVNIEKKELRIQRRLYTLLLVMAIGFGGLAVVMFQWCKPSGPTWRECAMRCAA
ncbi:MAG: hypothetical protein WCP34_10985 [Pseudomonadota bacterium]